MRYDKKILRLEKDFLLKDLGQNHKICSLYLLYNKAYSLMRYFGANMLAP